MKTTPTAEKLPNTIDPNLDLDKVKKDCEKLVKNVPSFLLVSLLYLFHFLTWQLMPAC